MRYTTNANFTPLLHVPLWCKPRGIGSVLSVKYMANIPICNNNIHLELGTTNIRSLYQVHDTRGTPKLHDKIYTLYTEFTHTPDLHLKLGTINTHSLHQIHITREIHQFYTFLKTDFEKYTGNTRCILSIFGVYSTYTIYTKNTRVILEYVSAGKCSQNWCRQPLLCRETTSLHTHEYRICSGHMLETTLRGTVLRNNKNNQH